MKRFRKEELSLSLSLSTDSTESPPSSKKVRRRPAKSGDGEFVCKTCNRAFTSFQALGGHRTSHMRGRHGLGLGLGLRAEKVLKEKDKARHECHICGLGFEMGQALGGHMRRHRDEAHGSGDLVQLSLGRSEGFGSESPPVLLELFA